MLDRTLPDGTAASYRILLVGAAPNATSVLATHLAHHGFTVVGRESSASAAAEAVRRERPDVVLIDAEVRDGWQAVVRALDGTPAERIAVLAAYWSTDARRAANATGIGAMLLKRVEGPDLIERLCELAHPAHPQA